jgi:hypothetical protein
MENNIMRKITIDLEHLINYIQDCSSEYDDEECCLIANTFDDYLRTLDISEENKQYYSTFCKKMCDDFL